VRPHTWRGLTRRGKYVQMGEKLLVHGTGHISVFGIGLTGEEA